ncbi:MAG: hypothetical protein KDE55_11775 [Novosphingobium sp.]|nr:hypothetical protein [Novosphingobium sp.]
MAEPKPDTDATEPIHFSEAYRRAKRNVLFWAVATITVALGAHSDNAIEVTGLVDGLAFRPLPLMLGLLIILGFMFAGYIRAERDLTFLNSEQVVSQRMNDAIEIAGSLKAKMEGLRRKVDSEERRLTKIYEGIEEARIQFDLSLEPALEKYMEETEVRIRTDLQSGDLSAKDAHEAAIRFAMTLREDTLALVSEWQRLHMEFAKTRPDGPSSDEADKAFENVTAPFVELASRLTGLAASISTSQKYWHYGQDRAPVWITSIAAVVLIFLRLGAGPTLDDWLGMGASEAEVATGQHQSFDQQGSIENQKVEGSSEPSIPTSITP